MSIKCSFYEIYNEIIIDLLQNETETNNNPSIKLQKSIMGDDYERVVGLKVVPVESTNEFLCHLKTANQNQKVAATDRNAKSSRSYGVIQLILNGLYNQVNFESTLMLLDLAGAEKATDHGNNGIDRSAETSDINKSGLAFSSVIECLTKKNHSFLATVILS